MEISIIVPVYNVEEYLIKCINSILSQTFTDFELILVDDGSKDGSGAICDEYSEKDNRVRVIHGTNGGASLARNIAMDSVNGKYTMFCDSDDFLYSDSMEILYSTIKKSNYDCVSMDYNVINSADSTERIITHFYGETVFLNSNDKIQYIKNKVLQGKTGWELWTRIFKTEIIQKNHLRLCETCENYAEDLGFVISYLMCCDKIYNLKHVGYDHFLRQNSIMDQNKNSIKLNALNEVSKWFYVFLNENDFEKEIIKEYPIIHFFIMFNQLSKIYKYNAIDSVPAICGKIIEKKWYNRMTCKITSHYKELACFYDKKETFEYWNLCMYTVHKCYKLFGLTSFVFYKLNKYED